jgi:hypothetical protein
MFDSDMSAGLGGLKASTQQAEASRVAETKYAEAIRRKIEESTLSPSEIEMLVSLIAINSPQLSQPVAGNSMTVGSIDDKTVVKLQLKAAEIKHDIITSMWDAFLVNLHEIADRAKKDDEAKALLERVERGIPVSGGEYYSYLLTLAASSRADELDGVDDGQDTLTQTFQRWLVDPTDQSGGAMINPFAVNPLGYPSLDFVASVMMLSPDIFKGPSTGSDISLSPVADAIAACGPTSGLPTDTQAAAALIAALLNGGAVSYANAQVVNKAEESQEVPKDLDFAINYAKSIAQIVSQMIPRMEDADTAAGQTDRMIAITLIAMAINMVYRGLYGGMTGQEFTELRNHPEKIPKEIKATLDQLMKLLDQVLPKDPVERAETLAAIEEYIDNKPSVEDMLSTTKLYSSYLVARRQISGSGSTVAG